MIARALTIAGSDPSGGAGIQQDLKTFHALGVWGMSAVTSITVQNTMGVSSRHDIDPDVVRAQIAAVVTDIGVDAAKTGMLPTRALIEAVRLAVLEHGIPSLVVDPVLVASSGAALADRDAAHAIRTLLLPIAAVVTPNADEARALTGVTVATRAGQIEAAHALRDLGARAALVTGGHVDGDASVDILVDESGAVHELVGPRITTPHTHGTGCAFSAAVTAGLAKGLDVETAAREAKGFVTGAIEHSLALGRGSGPVNPGWRDRDAPWPLAGHPFE